MATRWEKILSDHPRVILCGRSNTGKTKLASQVTDRPVICTDYQRFGGDCPDDISFTGTAYHFLERLMPEPRPGPWLLEGTQAIRVLRAGLRDHAWEPDAVVHLVGLYEPDDLPDPPSPQDDPEEVVRDLSGLVARAKGHATTWGRYLDLRDELGALATLYEFTEVEMEEEA